MQVVAATEVYKVTAIVGCCVFHVWEGVYGEAYERLMRCLADQGLSYTVEVL